MKEIIGRSKMVLNDCHTQDYVDREEVIGIEFTNGNVRWFKDTEFLYMYEDGYTGGNVWGRENAEKSLRTMRDPRNSGGWVCITEGICGTTIEKYPDRIIYQFLTKHYWPTDKSKVFQKVESYQ